MTIARYVLASWALIMLPGSTIAAQSRPGAAPAGVDSSSIPVGGVYTLVAVDDHALPYELRHDGAPPVEVLASTLIVRADGSFLQAMSYRFNGGGVTRFMAQPFSGRFHNDGGALMAKWDGAGLTPVSFARDTLVINNAGVRLQYLKGR